MARKKVEYGYKVTFRRGDLFAKPTKWHQDLLDLVDKGKAEILEQNGEIFEYQTAMARALYLLFFYKDREFVLKVDTRGQVGITKLYPGAVAVSTAGGIAKACQARITKGGEVTADADTAKARQFYRKVFPSKRASVLVTLWVSETKGQYAGGGGTGPVQYKEAARNESRVAATFKRLGINVKKIEYGARED